MGRAQLQLLPQLHSGARVCTGAIGPQPTAPPRMPAAAPTGPALAPASRAEMPGLMRLSKGEEDLKRRA